MYITIEELGRDFNVDNNLGKYLVSKGLATTNADLTTKSIAEWLEITYRVRPPAQEVYAAAFVHFKPSPLFMKRTTKDGTELLFNNWLRWGLNKVFNVSEK